MNRRKFVLHTTPAPIKALLASRKFLLLILDTIVSAVLFFTAKYCAPDLFDNIKFMITSLQPVFIALIAAIAIEDAAQKVNQ